MSYENFIKENPQYFPSPENSQKFDELEISQELEVSIAPDAFGGNSETRGEYRPE